MKVRWKNRMAALLLLAVLLLLGGCVDAKNRTSNVDEMTSAQFMQMSVGLLQNIFSLSDEDVKAQSELLLEEKQFVLAGGLKSYMVAKKEVGSFERILEDGTDVIKSEDGYTVYIQAQGQLRSCEIIIGFNKEATTITQLTFNPEYTRAEKVKNAGLNTVLGMGTVFIVLILIALIIGAFKYIHQWEQKFANQKTGKAGGQESAKKPEAPVISGAPKEPPLVDMGAVSPYVLGAAEAADFADYAGGALLDLTEDAELVAVLTAAIMAYRGSTGGSGLIVRSIKRTSKRHR